MTNYLITKQGKVIEFPQPLGGFRWAYSIRVQYRGVTIFTAKGREVTSEGDQYPKQVNVTGSNFPVGSIVQGRHTSTEGQDEEWTSLATVISSMNHTADCWKHQQSKGLGHGKHQAERLDVLEVQRWKRRNKYIVEAEFEEVVE